MARPKRTDPHTRFAHSLEEQIMVSDFSKRQRQILSFILRLSYGCGKDWATIPRQKDFAVVGISESHIGQELITLVNAKVISIEGDKYFFNKDYDQWRISLAKGYTDEKLRSLIKLNLNHQSKKEAKTNYKEMVQR